MARSSSDPGGRSVRWLDRMALALLFAGLVGYVMPFWSEGRLMWAFWVTLLATVLHIFTSHARGS